MNRTADKEDKAMENTMKELNLNELEGVTGGDVVQPTADQIEGVAKIIEWIKSWFD